MSLESLANQHRDALLARDAALASRISGAYRVAWQRWHATLAKLLKEMQTAEQQAAATGTPFNALIWLHQAQRLDTLLRAVQEDFGAFSHTAQQLVIEQQHNALEVGYEDSLALLKTRLPGIDLQFGRPSEQALDVLINRGASHIKIAALFQKMDRQTLDLVRKRLISGLLLGENPRQIARDLAQALKLPLNRALTIARTENINAYRTAALDTYRANSDVVTGWTWSAAPGACPFCQGMDGTHHTLGETLDSHPCCRCAMLPDTKSFDEILAA